MTKSQTNKLDKLWRERVKERDGFCCTVCGGTTHINVHHVVGRRNRHLRWDANNGICLCPLHHTFGIESAHQDPIWFIDWFSERFPERKTRIDELRNSTAVIDYEEIKESLE